MFQKFLRKGISRDPGSSSIYGEEAQVVVEGVLLEAPIDSQENLGLNEYR